MMEDIYDWSQSVFDDRWLSLMFRVVMVVFGVGAFVYLMSILTLHGQPSPADLTTKLVDLGFFALFALVAASIALRNGWAVPLWIVTAILQLLAFSQLPEFFAGSASRLTDPMAMMQTHVLFLALFAVLLLFRRLRSA